MDDDDWDDAGEFLDPFKDDAAEWKSLPTWDDGAADPTPRQQQPPPPPPQPQPPPPPQPQPRQLKRKGESDVELKKPKKVREPKQAVAAVPLLSKHLHESVFMCGQPLQGSHKNNVVVTLKPCDNATFFGYSLEGTFGRWAYTLMGPLRDRYTHTISMHNKFSPSDDFVWSIATKENKEEPLTIGENQFINKITKSFWCGWVKTDKRGFVFIAHSAYGFYCFLDDAPRPQRLILSYKQRPPIRIQIVH